MKETRNQEEITEQLQKLLHERGKEGLELARKTILEEKIECKEVKEALKYFMTECWHDVTRPALLSLICEAVGGDPNITTPIAASITLISGATGIHDDIIDQSKIKGSRPTVPNKFGQDIALLVGDALLFKGFTMLYKAIEKGVPAAKIAAISDIINRTFFELGDAEALTLHFRGRIDVTPEEYLRVVRKRSADIEAYTRISAILGNGSKEEIEALGEYGRILGMLAILRDDMIDMLDLDETIHRINKEYLPLVIVYALQNSKLKYQISDLLKKTTTTKDAKKLTILVDKAEGFNQMHNCMEELTRIAYKQIEKVNFNKNYLELLIRGQLLSDWRSYLTPECPDR
jgi:geranylgeranyl diphosphate synthase, type I